MSDDEPREEVLAAAEAILAEAGVDSEATPGYRSIVAQTAAFTPAWEDHVVLAVARGQAALARRRGEAG